jgi:hypothetical protein
MPSHFEKLAGHRRLPPGLVGARFTSRHVCEVLRKSALTFLAGHLTSEIRATLVRTATGKAGRRPTVMVAPELTTEQRRAVKVFDLERWFPTILSCMTLEAVDP